MRNLPDLPLGVILAGGQARRMGFPETGQPRPDKGRLLLGEGHSLIGEVIARLGPQCRGLVLSANGDPARFADLGLEVLPDSLPGFPGPLAGLLAGMDRAAIEGRRDVLTAAADTPFLPRDLGARLAEARREAGSVIALAASPGPEGELIRQPVFGLWPVALREDLRAALRGGLSKVGLWAAGHGVALARFSPLGGPDPFLNINTPEDLEAARQLWRARQG